MLHAGVFGAFESQIARLQFVCLSVSHAHDENVPLQRYTHTVQQLSAIVVTVVVTEDHAHVLLVDASGCHDCFTHVYDAETHRIAKDELVDITTLFAQDAGLIR